MFGAFAFHPDFTAVFFDNTPGDGEAETGAGVLPLIPAGGLVKSFK